LSINLIDFLSLNSQNPTMKKFYFLILLTTVLSFKSYSQVGFSPSQTQACLPATIIFTNTSSIGVNYLWNFGDGSSTTTNGFGTGTTHVYTTGGTFNVYMDAYDASFNYLGSSQFTITIEGMPSNLQISDSTICPTDETSFDIGQSNSDDITWNFGDGVVLSNTDYMGVRHVYSSIGTYTVTATAVYPTCGVYIANATVYVGNSYPVGGNYSTQIQSYPDTACPNDQVEFYIPYQFSNYYINYGDGQIENNTSSHKYSTNGNYPITVTLINGCGNSLDIYDTVQVRNNLPAQIPYLPNISNQTYCINTNAELSYNYSPRFSEYLWDFGNNQTYNTENISVNYALPGAYPFSITLTNGCGNSGLIFDTLIIDNDLPVTGLALDGFFLTEACPGDGFFLEATCDTDKDEIDYTWDFGDGNTDEGFVVEHQYASTGVYTISITATNGCGNSETINQVFNVANNIIPNPNDYFYGIPDESPACPGDSLIFVFAPGGSGGTVEYDFGDGNSGIATKTITVQGVTYRYIKHAYPVSGTYNGSLTYTNSCGNSFNVPINANVSNGIQVEADLFQDLLISTCIGQPLDFYAMGGNTFVWDFGDGTGNLITNSPLTAVPHAYSAPGNYLVTVAVTNGCGLTETAELNVNIPATEINIVTNTINSSCLNSDGKAVAVVSGGKAPYTYLWSNGDQSFIADSIPAGIYLVNVTDKSGCKNFAIATVSDDEGATILTSALLDINCYGGNNGAIDISVIGNSSPFTYAWSNGSTSQDVNQLEAGPHEVVVTDANGCVATKSIYLSEPDEVLLSTVSKNASCGVADGEAGVAVVGTTGPYNFLWSNGGNNDYLIGLAAGVYNITVVDANGCIFEESVSVSEGNLNIILDSIVGTGCIGDLANIYVNVLPTSGNYTYNWSNSTTSEDLLNAGIGNYVLEVTDINNNCFAYGNYEIDNISPSQNDICIVTVDSISNTNRVVWEKDLNATNISHYNIYKESSQSGVYYLVDEVPYDSLSKWIDPVSNPQVRAWRYKISVVDDCGNESVVSNEHKTIHLTVNEGINNSYNLIWDHYDGLNYSTYEIYRKTNGGVWTLVTSLPSNLNSYTDVTPPVGTEYYRVEAIMSANCEPTRAGVNTSRSNVKNTPNAAPFGQSISESELNLVSIYPNPSTGIYNINIPKGLKLELTILNSIGATIISNSIESNSMIDLSAYSNGLYFLQLKENQNTKTFKLIKQ